MTNSNLSPADQRLLALLRDDARASVSELARKLSLSRSTVQSRLKKLEQSGVISGYRVELGERFRAQQVEAHVLIKLVQKLTHSTEKALQPDSEYRSAVVRQRRIRSDCHGGSRLVAATQQSAG